VTTRKGFTHSFVAGIIRTRFTADTLAHVFTSLSTPTRCLARSSFALKTLTSFLVTTGIRFIYSSYTFHIFTRLSTKPWTRVTTIEILVAAFLAYYVAGIATTRHFKGVVSCAVEILHHHLLAEVPTALLRTFPRTLMTAQQLFRTLI